MARPPKKRFVCCMPQTRCLSPDHLQSSEVVNMTVDEYEVIRLIDLEACTQEQCAAQIHVARTTVQSIYNSARQKLAKALVCGQDLRITGGDYRLCECYREACGTGCRKRCHRHLCGMEPAVPESPEKEETTMIIAVTFENGQIFQHFGHTEQFKLYEITDHTITASRVVDTMGSGHGALASFLKEQGVQALICGGIGGGAKTALAEAGIQLYGGCNGSADDAVAALLQGTLAFHPDVMCSHHDHENGAHTCGEHGCGSHNCGNH